MLTLYGGSSPNVRKVSILLEELELPHDYKMVYVWKGENYTPEFERMNPVKKIPVLVDPDGPRGADGQPCTVFESGAILFYLAEKHGRFLPASGAARYAVMQWLMVQMAGIGPMFSSSHTPGALRPGQNDYALARYETQARRGACSRRSTCNSRQTNTWPAATIRSPTWRSIRGRPTAPGCGAGSENSTSTSRAGSTACTRALRCSACWRSTRKSKRATPKRD